MLNMIKTLLTGEEKYKEMRLTQPVLIKTVKLLLLV